MKEQTSASTGNHDGQEYDDFLRRVENRFRLNVGTGPLFTTDADGMWPAYLAAMPDEHRQYHNCHACRQFIERFGPLATISEAGGVASAVWNEDDAPEFYKPAIRAMERIVRRAKITGVFLCESVTWGTPVTGVWTHFALTPPREIIYRRSVLTAGQAMAEKREDFKTVMTALNEFSLPVIEQALTLLRTESLYRSEKVVGPAQWLHDLHAARAATKGAAKANVVWRAIAAAPPGFCHPRSSMVGTLLEDIAGGMNFAEVSKRFADKMHPLQYQRPQAAPTAGAIASAEKVMQQLGAAGSLARRFCRVDEVQALWRPTLKKDEAPAGGVFGHLKPKGAEAPNMSIPAQTMTWDKFQRTVLPTAERIEFLAPSHGGYSALVTAANADAPPILQWDREDARNPVSWYFWNGGSSAGSFGLRGGCFVEVEAVTLKPSMWNGGNDHQGAGVLFILAGARESRQSGTALFPEILKAEFHGIRSVIEAFSRNASIEGMGEPHAAGVMLNNGDKNWNATVRVWSAGKSLDYRLDRWD